MPIELRKKRVTWSKWTIEIREESGMDTFQEPPLFWRIVEAVHGDKYPSYFDMPLAERNAINELTAMISRTLSIEGDLGMIWPNGGSSAEELKQAYASLCNLPGGLVRLWREAIIELASVPMGDPDLLPPEQLPNAKKKVK